MILEAERVLEHARETFDEHQKIVARLEKLSGSGFVPYQDYEIALSTRNLFMINIEIAEAQLKSVQTGLKQEEVEMISSQITSLEEEIDTLLERSENYTLTSPLSGVVFETSPGDTLVSIGDTSSYTVIIPLKLKNRNYVNPQQYPQVFHMIQKTQIFGYLGKPPVVSCLLPVLSLPQSHIS